MANYYIPLSIIIFIIPSVLQHTYPCLIAPSLYNISLLILHPTAFISDSTMPIHSPYTSAMPSIVTLSTILIACS